MTDDEWLTSTDRELLLEAAGDRATDRKLRLFACACCSRIPHRILEQHGFGDAIQVALDFADGLAAKEAVDAVLMSLDEAGLIEEVELEIHATACAVGWLLRTGPLDWDADTWTLAGAMDRAVSHAVIPCDDRAGEYAAQADLLRDVFGNPLRPAPFSPAWRTSDAVAIASQMYESRDFGAMPILADALQDAGCDNEDLLSHCRDTSLAHVRGCWAVDLVLGRG